MVSKSQLLKNDKSKDAHTANETTSGLNRRQFLRQVGISAGAGLLATQSMTQALAANTIQQDKSTQLTKDDLPTALMNENLPSQQAAPEILQPNTRCITPSIETRLFASSNVGGSDERNELALQRLACAGFKVNNPAITKRQYLRFAGTDSQRASDLQNIATGAIKAP